MTPSSFPKYEVSNKPRSVHTAEAVRDSLIAAFSDSLSSLCRTLPWNEAAEMSEHTTVVAATGVHSQSCDLALPWQRGMDENTDGLLLQQTPRTSDLTTRSLE